MSRLLSAGFMRLWKSKVFWAEIVIMFAWSVATIIANYNANIFENKSYTLDDFFFWYSPIIGACCSTFTSLFWGTEYSDGTIRNKLTIGHLRKDIYLSAMIISTVAGLLMITAFLIPMLTLGAMLLGVLHCSWVTVLLYLLVSIFMVISFNAIFIPICMLNQNKSIVVIVSFLFFLALLYRSTWYDNKLAEPEFLNNYTVAYNDENGPVYYEKPKIDNPSYVRGIRRERYQFWLDFLPTGQAVQISYMKATNILHMIFYSVCITVVITAGGLFCFNRKDIN